MLKTRRQRFVFRVFRGLGRMAWLFATFGYVVWMFRFGTGIRWQLGRLGGRWRRIWYGRRWVTRQIDWNELAVLADWNGRWTVAGAEGNVAAAGRRAAFRVMLALRWLASQSVFQLLDFRFVLPLFLQQLVYVPLLVAATLKERGWPDLEAQLKWVSLHIQKALRRK